MNHYFSLHPLSEATRKEDLAEQTSWSEWTSVEKALAYLERVDSTPHRAEGERVILDLVPQDARRILDLGTGDGRLLDLLKIERPSSSGVALDFSPTMLEAARRRFEGDPSVRVVEHDLREPLPELEPFDAVVSCFAIHHCEDERKRALYDEVYALLKPGGVFCNLEIVSSPTQRLRERFLTAIGHGPDRGDRSGHLLDVETQLRWLRDIGFDDVDCHWKWLGMALLGGAKPERSANAR